MAGDSKRSLDASAPQAALSALTFDILVSNSSFVSCLPRIHPVRAVLALALAGCGPEAASVSDAETSGSTAADTSASTIAPSTATSSSDTAPSDTVTSIDPSDAGAEVGPDSGEVETSMGGAFIIPPDGGVVCSSCECSVWSQDCLPGSQCVPWANDGGDAWNATRCVEIDPAPAAVGEPCLAEGSGVSGLDDCAAGSICWGVDPETLAGTCVAMCSGSENEPVCDDGLGCVRGFDGNVIVCLPPCDPLTPSCGASEACMFTGNDEPFATFACLPVPPFVAGGDGEPCDGAELQRCDSGLVCAPGEHVPGCAEAECCTRLGVAAQNPTCPDDAQSCLPLDEADPDGLCFCGVGA